MFLFCLVFAARAGPPRVFTGNTFLDTENQNPESLQAKLTDLQKVTTDIGSAKDELVDWAEKFHKFKAQVEKQVLLEILTLEGLKEYLKELHKCGVSDTLQNEDLHLPLSLCYEQNKIEVFIEFLIKKVTENANVCINVKEKYRARIQESYDEYFYHQDFQEIEKQEKVPSAPVLIQLESFTKRLKVVYLGNREKLEIICKDFQDLAEKFSAIRETTFEQLGLVFVLN